MQSSQHPTHRALLTGGTSFTGLHLAQAFAKDFDLVCCVRTQHQSAWSTRRLEQLRTTKGVKIVSYDGFETPSFISLLNEFKPEVVISHGAAMERYRQPDYDLTQALRVSALPLPQVLPFFQKNGGRLWIHSGTIFEPDEGAHGQPSPALSPYGASKNMVYQLLRYYANQLRLPLLKVIIPNPIGPFENGDRMIPLFIQQWKNGQTPKLTTPWLVRDNIPASWLASCYSRKALELLKASPEQTASLETVFRPSGIISTLMDFTRLLSDEMSSRLKIQTPLQMSETPTDQPLVRTNTEDACAYLGLDRSTAMKDFWNELARYYEGHA